MFVNFFNFIKTKSIFDVVFIMIIFLILLFFKHLIASSKITYFLTKVYGKENIENFASITCTTSSITNTSTTNQAIDSSVCDKLKYILCDDNFTILRNLLILCDDKFSTLSDLLILFKTQVYWGGDPNGNKNNWNVPTVPLSMTYLDKLRDILDNIFVNDVDSANGINKSIDIQIAKILNFIQTNVIRGFNHDKSIESDTLLFQTYNGWTTAALQPYSGITHSTFKVFNNANNGRALINNAS